MLSKPKYGFCADPIPQTYLKLEALKGMSSAWMSHRNWNKKACIGQVRMDGYLAFIFSETYTQQPWTEIILVYSLQAKMIIQKYLKKSPSLGP